MTCRSADRRALGDRDDGRDEQHAKSVCDTDGDERGDPQASVSPAGERAEDEKRHSGAERLLGEVERELHRTLAAIDGERETRAGDLAREQRERGGEEEAEDEPDLRHRERVRLLTEVDVDRPRLGDVERERDPPPRQPRTAGCVAEGEAAPPDEAGRRRDRRRQEPDGSGASKVAA